MNQRPRLLVVAGPNGSGKTTVTERGLAHTWFSGCDYINPDLIAQQEFGDWNNPIVVAKAAGVATERRQRCIDLGRSLAFETVFSAPDKVEFVREARRRGYFCRLFFVGTASATINAARVAHRVLAGGHDVPITKIISRYHRAIANCTAVAAEVDRLYLYDNSIDDVAPRLFMRAADGGIVRDYGNVPAWAVQIVAQLRAA